MCDHFGLGLQNYGPLWPYSHGACRWVQSHAFADNSSSKRELVYDFWIFLESLRSFSGIGSQNVVVLLPNFFQDLRVVRQLVECILIAWSQGIKKKIQVLDHVTHCENGGSRVMAGKDEVFDTAGY